MSCASGEGIPPSGGPPDKTAPTVQEMTPLDGTTMFEDDRIEIRFSEGIDETGVRDQVVITPIPSRSPTVSVSGKTLRIDFQDELLPDRTYAVTVGGGVRDYSGNRLGTPVTVRFSTGAIIDSGRIAGSISGVGANAGTTFVFAWRMNHRSDTVDLSAIPPDFIAPVSDNGRFSLEGLSAGTYRIAGVNDQRRDREFDPGEDALGTATGIVTIGTGESYEGNVAIRLPAVADDLLPPSLYTASGEYRTRTILRFSEPIDSAGLEPGMVTITQGGVRITPETVWRSATTPTNILLQHTQLTPDQEVTVEVTGLSDTAGNRLVDSTRTRKFRGVERTDTTGPALSFGGDLARGVSGKDTIRLIADEGVRIVDPEKGLIGTDTSGTPVTTYRLELISADLIRGVPQDTILPRIGILRLQIDQAGFADLGGRRGTGIIDTTLPITPTPQLGTLTGNVVDSLYRNVPHIIVLRSESGTEYRVPLRGTGPWTIENIPSGAYSLSAFRDDNGDGRFNYGEISPWRAGERSVEYPGGIRVRPRWTTTDVNLEF